MTIIDYIKMHKDEDFKEFLFTEVDNLILSLVSYMEFKGIIPAFKEGKITLREAVNKLNLEHYKYKVSFLSNTYKILNLMKETKRYGNIYLYNYMSLINTEMQFRAITMSLNDKSIYVSFSGTDTSIIGWEEDFKMAYMYPGVSQKYAGIYLNKTLGLSQKKIRIGGHSKGGNLAISAGVEAKWYIRKNILEIYNNDGPGFLKEQIEAKEYKRIEKKIKMYVPRESIIGMILYHTKDYVVVKSKSFSILQHDAFNWVCSSNSFVRAIQHKRSKALEEKLTKKLELLPKEERIKIVKDLFRVFRDNNIRDTKDIKLNNVFKLLRDFKRIDKDTINNLIELLVIVFLK